jgi:hypothetical protein
MNHIKYSVVIILILYPIFSFSQSASQVQEIVSTYDAATLKSKQSYLNNLLLLRKKRLKSYTLAGKTNVYTSFTPNHKEELVNFTSDGFPLYYSTENIDAAFSTRTNFLYLNGGLGLSLHGENMVARLWDSGKVRSSHIEFSSRVSVMDDLANEFNNDDHATHVLGTMIAAGIDPIAKGMAFKATARTFNWTEDDIEAFTEAKDEGMLVSNHSYGIPIVNGNGNSLPSWFIGAYTEDSKVWDGIAFACPYYLMVTSAGNSGLVTNPVPNANGLDKLTGNKVSKNNLVVANATDCSINSDGSLDFASINNSSSQGPSDDGRIKPDITGNGTSVFSSVSTSDTSYDTYSGTSMSSPNVAGSLLLLQQYYYNLNSKFMLSSTLKGLVCHTADDAGFTGPDPIFGWGVLNLKRAAEVLTANNSTSVVKEEVLSLNEEKSYEVYSSGSKPLLASITWTDPEGVELTSSVVVNTTVPSLINDLDIVVRRGANEYFPWKLQSDYTLEAVRNSSNSVDNVERVQIDTPIQGNYTVIVKHKGVLVNGKQNFSLVITGFDSLLDNDSFDFNNNVVIYPNPASNILNFSTPSGEALSNVVIFDALGKEIKISKSVLNNTLDISELSSGLYIAKFFHNGKLMVNKFIKE